MTIAKMRVRSDQVGMAKTIRWGGSSYAGRAVYQVREEVDDVIPRQVATADWLVFARGMMGGDTSHMID